MYFLSVFQADPVLIIKPSAILFVLIQLPTVIREECLKTVTSHSTHFAYQNMRDCFEARDETTCLRACATR